MNDQEASRLNRELGELKGELRSFKETWQKQDDIARSGRRELHAKFDELKDTTIEALHATKLQIEGVLHRVGSISDALGKIEPQLAISNNDQQQREGHNKALAKVWATLIGIVTLAGGVGAAITELVHLFWPVKPH